MTARDPLAAAYRLGAATQDWTDTVAWWTDPRLAYAAGLHDGAALAQAERLAELRQLVDAADEAAATGVGYWYRRLRDTP